MFMPAPSRLQEEAFLKSLPVVERKMKEKGKGKLRFCQECLMYKPDRTHHCKHCKQCVSRPLAGVLLFAHSTFVAPQVRAAHGPPLPVDRQLRRL